MLRTVPGGRANSWYPSTGTSWKFEDRFAGVLGTDGYRLFSLVVQSPSGETVKVRLPAAQYLDHRGRHELKQRIRKMLEYFHADRLNYAVVRFLQPSRDDSGFFVRLGHGAADVKPIAHLYKTQVYELAELPRRTERIRSAAYYDTYSLAQTQDELLLSRFHMRRWILSLRARSWIPAEQVPEIVGVSGSDVSRVFADIARKRRTTRYLRLPPQLVSPVSSLDERGER